MIITLAAGAFGVAYKYATSAEEDVRTYADGFLLVAKTEQDIQESLAPRKSWLYSSLLEKGFLTEDESGAATLHMEQVRAAAKVDSFAATLREEGCYDNGTLSKDLLEAKLFTPSPLSEALERNGTTLEQLYRTNQFTPKNENGELNWFGIRQLPDGSLTLIPSKMVGFQINNESDFDRAVSLANQVLTEKGTKSSLKKHLRSQERFLAADGEICLPIWFELETSLPVQNPAAFHPDARPYPVLVERETDLPAVITTTFIRDTNFKGNQHDLRNAIVQQSPGMMRQNGSLEAPFTIMVNPMKRSWKVSGGSQDHWSLTKEGAGHIRWIHFPYQFKTVLGELRKHVEGFPKEMDAEGLKRIYLQDPNLVDEFGSLRLPIGTYIATNGSNKYRMFSGQDEPWHTIPRPRHDGRYELDINSSLNLISAMGHLKVDGGVPTGWSYDDLVQNMSKKYPQFVVAGDLQMRFTLRITPKGTGGPGYELVEPGTGSRNGIQLVDQSTRANGDISGFCTDDVHLIEVARLLRLYGGEKVKHADEWDVRLSLLSQPRFTTPGGNIRYNVYFWINVDSGEYEFLSMEEMPYQTKILSRENLEKFSTDEGINPDALLKGVGKHGIRIPFIAIVDPLVPKKYAGERYEFVNLDLPETDLDTDTSK